jgi:glutamate-1-semialdehyde 2,1-aminomutase
MGMVNARELLEINDLDERIWREELEEFVPARLYDMHNHLTRSEFDLSPPQEAAKSGGPATVLGKNCSLEVLDACEAVLYPGREVLHLLMPWPYRHRERTDFKGVNEFIAQEAVKKPGTSATLMIDPQMTAEEVDQAIIKHRYVGFKPYLFYSVTGDIWNCRITDFMPEHLIAVANRYGLLIQMHLSKKMAIADPENLDDLERLTEKYPRVRWLLSHCARSYSNWAIERAAPRLHHIPNIWIEGSSVCESDAFTALFSNFDLARVCYGSDDLDAGIWHGKYVTWGYAWTAMDPKNQTFPTPHCDGRMTFVRYEMLRAMRQAAMNARLSRAQIEDVFYNNGASLIASVRRDMTSILGD